MTRNLLLLSTSTVHGSSFLDYCIGDVEDHFTGISEIIFIPFARPGGITYDQYTNLVRSRFSKIGIEVTGVHELKNPSVDVTSYKGVYIGGGNTFLLLRDLYQHNLVDILKKSILEQGMRYMGSSAGSNVACRTINNTNDMPIVYPPTFNALSLVPFNINPHYMDPDPASKHKGETRETRIKEFHFQSDIPVIGLREGSHLKIDESNISIGGELPIRLFRKGSDPNEIKPEENISFLLA